MHDEQKMKMMKLLLSLVESTTRAHAQKTKLLCRIVLVFSTAKITRAFLLLYGLLLAKSKRMIQRVSTW